MLLGKSGGDGNEQSKCQNEEASIFRSINFRNKQDCYVSVLGWYNYTKPKYGDNSRLCYMDTDSFIVHVKLEDVYEDHAEDVEIKFYISNYEIKRPLSIG